jgi:hypothetical protein
MSVRAVIVFELLQEQEILEEKVDKKRISLRS